MNFNEIDELTSPENKAKAELASASIKSAQVSLSQAYARLLATDDGKRVLEDLTTNFIYSNDTAFSSNNINYESAYHNGESGVVKYMINQMQRAEVI